MRAAARAFLSRVPSLLIHRSLTHLSTSALGSTVSNSTVPSVPVATTNTIHSTVTTSSPPLVPAPLTLTLSTLQPSSRLPVHECTMSYLRAKRV